MIAADGSPAVVAYMLAIEEKKGDYCGIRRPTHRGRLRDPSHKATSRDGWTSLEILKNLLPLLKYGTGESYCSRCFAVCEAA